MRTTTILWRRLGLFALLLSTLPLSAQDDGSTKAPTTPDTLIEKARKALVELGYAVPDAVKQERRTPVQVRADFDALQSDDRMLAQFWLLRSVRRFRVASPGALRKAIVRSMSLNLSAYYHPPRKAFVTLDTPTRKLNEVMSGDLLPLITHELVHANQDTRGRSLLDGMKNAGSADALAAFRCVVEGEAEIVAIAALQGEAHLDKMTADDLDLGGLEASMVGFATARIYAAGRLLSLARHKQDGFDGLRALFDSPPTSTEQIIHLEKLGKDLPVKVPMPDLSRLPGLDEEYEVICKDTFGQLQIHSMLQSLGRLDPKTATLAAIGWDGDTLVVLRAKGQKDACAAAWRIVFDRQEDALQFQHALDSVRGRRTLTDRKGRAVDCYIALTPELRKGIWDVMRAQPYEGEANAEDALTTAAAEQAAQARLSDSTVTGDTWTIASVGLQIPIPEGWKLHDFRGMKVLRAPLARGSSFGTNVTVQTLPNGSLPLDKHLELNKQEFDRMDSITVDKLGIEELSGHKVIRGEYQGVFPGQQVEMHNLVLIYMRGRKQVVITGAISAAEWDTFGKQMQGLFDGIKIAR